MCSGIVYLTATTTTTSNYYTSEPSCYKNKCTNCKYKDTCENANKGLVYPSWAYPTTTCDGKTVY